ncbi:Sad1-interacting factor 3 [Collariella sp. IMI 366227]|nr:Sad1-interacting factor 3 [Collariella sp. IMI 366227]
MCIVFTCGEHTFRKEVEGYEGIVCRCYNCGNYSASVVKSNPWFTFCFIKWQAINQGTGLPTLASARTGQQNVPSRTTKISEKLVLLPEAPEERDEEGDSDDELVRRASILRSAEDEDRPLKDEELDVLRKRGGIRGKTHAERLPKVQRGEKVARLTAYSTAQAYKIKPTAEFLRKKHEAKAKLYEDCLYSVYHLPLLPGIDGYRLRSRPILKTPGTGKTVLDIEIERSERRDEHEGFWDEYSYGGQGFGDSPNAGTFLQQVTSAPDTVEHPGSGDDHNGERVTAGPINRLAPDAKNFGEMFVFSYGVVVFWNFTEHQEKDILADLTFSENETGISLATRPLDEMDFETEEFHFEYSADVKRPRVFNDMITLLPKSDHMVKLTISHAIAQSTKLCFFEERMSETMLDAQHVPKRLALTGELNMTRTEIVQIDSVADAKMSTITWIIIILIVASIVVTVTEVGLRFVMLSKGRGAGGG